MTVPPRHRPAQPGGAVGEEREAERELSLPTALPKCQKNTRSKKQTHALSLFTAAGSRGEQPGPGHLQPAQAVGHGSSSHLAALQGWGRNRGLLQRDCVPLGHPHRLRHLPRPETRARTNLSPVASGFWAQRVPQRNTKDRLARSVLSAGSWQLYISLYSMQRIMMSKQSSESNPTAPAPSAAAARLPAARRGASHSCDGAFPPQGTTSPPHPLPPRGGGT